MSRLRRFAIAAALTLAGPAAAQMTPLPNTPPSGALGSVLNNFGVQTRRASESDMMKRRPPPKADRTKPKPAPPPGTTARETADPATPATPQADRPKPVTEERPEGSPGALR